MTTSASASATPHDSASPAPPTVPSAVTAAMSAAADHPGDPVSTLFGSLALELKNRPHVHPNVDDGWAALAKAGVPVPAPAQGLGRTYKASYCAHGVLADNTISVALCEYADEKLALAGLAEAKTLFPGMESRETLGRKTLVCVVTFQAKAADRSAKTIEEHKKIVAAFNAL